MTKSSLTPDTVLDRRTFLTGVGFASGAVVVGAMLPGAFLEASSATAALTSDVDGLWSVDVMCGHWPPYSHPIPYGRPRTPDVGAAAVNFDPTLYAFGLEPMLVA